MTLGGGKKCREKELKKGIGLLFIYLFIFIKKGLGVS